MMARASVFYSWQSDLPSKTNRGLIQDSLERAAKKLRADDSLGVEPVIDRDTEGIAGSPDIHAAILGKIAACDAAVFDVSFVQQGQRLHPNPNVLIELGFALGTIGWERIVLVFNDKHGDVEKLPFDIRGKRVLKYSMAQEEEPAAARTRLVADLEERIRVILTQHPREVAPDAVTKAIAALHEGKPGAIALVRAAITQFVTELTAKKPTPEASEANHAAMVRAFAETSSAVSAFAQLATAIVDCKHADGLDALLGAIERLAGAQELQQPGSARPGDFDVQRLLVREVVTSTAAVCLKSGNWSMLQQLGAHRFAFKVDFREQTGSFVHLLRELELFRAYEQANQINAGTGIGKLLKERYGSQGLGGIRFEELREADFFLYELTELEPQQAQDFFRWVPLLFPLGERDAKAIGWVRRATSASWLAKVAGAMGMNSATFKARYAERWGRVAEIFQHTWWTLGHDLNWILLEPTELATET